MDYQYEKDDNLTAQFNQIIPVLFIKYFTTDPKCLTVQTAYNSKTLTLKRPNQ